MSKLPAQLAKHRVTYVHPINNTRDTAGTAPACAGCGVLPAPVVDGERVLCPECCAFKQANHVDLTDYPGDAPC